MNMYNKSDKQRLYWLIDEYLLNRINEPVFCNEFHDSFVNEINIEIFTELEYSVFSELSAVSQRFSEYEEDHKLWKGFTSADDLRQKIIETKEKLQKQSPI
ncbi:MAG TPA: hypothetical protein PK275_10880 [Chitinophagaceae bacterium]|nr:hypothetical protein [Chitinophagaceae bacterium]